MAPSKGVRVALAGLFCFGAFVLLGVQDYLVAGFAFAFFVLCLLWVGV